MLYNNRSPGHTPPPHYIYRLAADAIHLFWVDVILVVCAVVIYYYSSSIIPGNILPIGYIYILEAYCKYSFPSFVSNYRRLLGLP